MLTLIAHAILVVKNPLKAALLILREVNIDPHIPMELRASVYSGESREFRD